MATPIYCKVDGKMGPGRGRAPTIVLESGANLSIDFSYYDGGGQIISLAAADSNALYLWKRDKWAALDPTDTDESFTASGTGSFFAVNTASNDLDVGEYRYGLYFTDDAASPVAGTFAFIGTCRVI